MGTSARRRLWYAVLVATCLFHVVRKKQGQECAAPTILVHVVTCCRPASLERLLTSLLRADYGAPGNVDLNIQIDWSTRSELTQKSFSLAKTFDWPHGSKTIHARVRTAGLASSWFELGIQTNRDYMLVLEDDLELSPHFYRFLELAHCKGSLNSESTTALCLHPGDWQIRVKPFCDRGVSSNIFYETPEPCNWAPVWKTGAWLDYINWLHRALAMDVKPYVPDVNNITYNYNSYVDRGIDVQSPWVWRYNWEQAKRQIRYSFTRCGVLNSERYFAINHKEPGLHFKKKQDFDNSPSLLQFRYARVRKLIDQCLYLPAKFSSKMLMPRHALR